MRHKRLSVKAIRICVAIIDELTTDTPQSTTSLWSNLVDIKCELKDVVHAVAALEGDGSIRVKRKMIIRGRKIKLWELVNRA